MIVHVSFRWLLFIAVLMIFPVYVSEAWAQECETGSEASCTVQCEAGHAVSCHLLAADTEKKASSRKILQDRTIEVKDAQGMKKAIGWYGKACKGGFSWSCYRLVKIDSKNKAKWRGLALRRDRKECKKKKVAEACVRLAIVHKEGKVVPQQLGTSYRLFNQACKMGHAGGAHMRGWQK